MQRRRFLQSSALASTLLLVPKFLHALDRPENRLAARLRDAPGGQARRLVVVQLGGGNDGLNTIIPYRNDLYYQARPTLALRAASTRVWSRVGVEGRFITHWSGSMVTLLTVAPTGML